jgi:hypothetical protein
MEEVWNHLDSSWRCLPGQTEQSEEKGLGQGGAQEPDDHSDRAPEFLCGDGRTLQKDNHLCSKQAFMVEWPDGIHSSVNTHMTARLEYAKKGSQNMRNKILWSD